MLTGIYNLIMSNLTSAVLALPQKGGKAAALVVAVLMFLLMTAVIYVTYYILWGRHRKNVRKEEKKHETETVKNKEDNGNVRWGVSKDSYCYPTINDILGYEFIKIIKVPVDGQKEEKVKDVQTEYETRPKKAGLMTSTDAGNTEQDNEGNVINEPVESTAGRQQAEEIKEEKENKEANDDRLPVDELDKVESGMSDDEMEALEEYEGYLDNPFPGNDPLNEMSDSEYHDFLSSNEDRLPDGETEPDTDEVQDEERKIYEMMQQNSIAQQELMEELHNKTNRIMSEMDDDEN